MWPPTRSSGPGPQTVPPRNFGNGPPPGAGVGPMSADVGKKDEGGDSVQALSLLQKIMTPEDFVKCQLLISPKQKQNKKTREQELADKVKSQEKLRSQETSHKGQIDKLELDLQRHRDICSRVFLSGFGWLMMRSKISGYKLREKSLIVVMVTMLQFGLLLQRRLTLNLKGGSVVGAAAPTPLHPGPFESCDEDIGLFDASEAEDEREVRRNGIWGTTP